jgi:hypothetical protein
MWPTPFIMKNALPRTGFCQNGVLNVMSKIPRSALFLGLLGLVPFVVMAGTDLAHIATPLKGWQDRIALHYGVVILSFMSGVLWGFATKAEGRTATIGYGLSVIPALWAFFTTLGSTSQGLTALIFGFVGLFALDWFFWHKGLAPHWWLRLRALLTFVVVACLLGSLYAT